MSEDSIERNGIKWGDRIPVNGDRPEWIRDHDIIRAWTKGGREWTPYRTAVRNGWKDTGFIALYADHPYYAQEKREIDPALVERMVALVKELAIEAREPVNSWFHHWVEARDIIKALEPVDSAALQAAKEIAQSRKLLPVNEMEVQNSVIETLMEAIQRGRQLEREETEA